MGTPPIFPYRNTGGEGDASLLTLFPKVLPPFSLLCPVVLRGVAEQYKGDTEGTIVAKERG